MTWAFLRHEPWTLTSSQVRRRLEADGRLRPCYDEWATSPEGFGKRSLPSEWGKGMAKSLWAGLDVGTETTRVCVVDDFGSTIHEATCPTILESVHRELRFLRRRRSATVALEAATGMNLARGLRNLGYQVDLYEQRQLSKFLRLRRNKTDAGDAAGIADAARLGAATISKVHLKSLDCQLLHSRLTIRRRLIRQRVQTVNLIGRQLETYGGRLNSTRRTQLRPKVEGEIVKIFGRRENDLTRDWRHLLDQCEQLWDRQDSGDLELRRSADQNDVCRRLMTIPGVGPFCALSFFAAVGEPRRFRRCADIGPYFGLTPSVLQSGLMFRAGRISKMGNCAVRCCLVQSSMSFLRWGDPNSRLGLWARKVEERRGRRKATIALARKLATVMLAIWKNGDSYKP